MHTAVLLAHFLTLPTSNLSLLSSCCQIMANNAAGLTDVSVLGHLDHDLQHPNASSTDFLAASSLASSCIFAMNVFIFAGFANAISVLCSQAYGADNPTRAVRFFYAGLVLSLCASVPIGIGQYFIADIVDILLPGNASTQRHTLIQTFSRLFVFRLPIWTVGCCVVQFLRSANVVKVPLLVSVCGMIFNIGANVVFVYGVDVLGCKLGGWGFSGSPLATVATEHVKTIALLLYLFLGSGSQYHEKSHAVLREIIRCRGKTHQYSNELEESAPEEDGASGAEAQRSGETNQQWISWTRVHIVYLKQAIPLAMGGVFEEWQIQVIGFFAGGLGGVSLAANNGLMNVFVTLSALNYGIMSATTVRVGYFLGEGSPRKARAVSALALLISLCAGTLISGTLVIFRDDLGKIFSSDENVRDLTSRLCWLVGPTYVFLCVFFVCVALLQGQGRPLALAISFAVGAWLVSVPAAWYFAFGGPDWGLWGVWLGLVFGYGVITAMCLYFTCTSDWDKIAAEASRRGGKLQGEKRMYEALDQSLEDPLL